MIGKLQGIVDYIGDGFIILLVHGVGYKVFTAEYLTHKSTVELWIETVVREDSIRLFGFSTLQSQDLFNMLTGVSGVGPKVADCVSLFGFNRTDSFPVDTWIQKVYQQDFDGKLTDRNKIAEWFVNKFGKYSGYFQQYLFYYKRSLEN